MEKESLVEIVEKLLHDRTTVSLMFACYFSLSLSLSLSMWK